MREDCINRDQRSPHTVHAIRSSVLLVCDLYVYIHKGGQRLFLFSFSSSGGWVNVKVKLPHSHVCLRHMSYEVCQFNSTLPLQQQQHSSL